MMQSKSLTVYNNSHTQMDSNTSQAPSNCSFIRLITVLLLRAGSLMVQLGTFPTENVYNIILQNVVDMAVAVLSFATLGCFLSLGENTVAGVLSYGSWIGSKDVDVEKATYGICASLVASHVITSQTSGRLHLIATVLVSFVNSGVLLPLTMHWTWHENGWMSSSKFMGTEVTFLDHGGGFVIYGTAGIAGFVGMLKLGRRLLRLNVIDVSSIGAESLGTTVFGYFLIYVGMLSMSMTSSFRTSLKILLTNITSGAVGALTTLFVQAVFCKEDFNYWALVRLIQTNLVTIVMIAPCTLCYGTLGSLAISLVGIMIFVAACKMIQRSSCEDYCNCTASYLITGSFAILFPQFFRNIKKDFSTFTKNLLWQLLCYFTILATYLSTFFIVFCLLDTCGCLRNRSDQICHDRARKLQRHVKRTFFKRFFANDTNATILEPGGKVSDKTSDSTLPPPKVASATSALTKDGEGQESNIQDEDIRKKSIFTLLSSRSRRYFEDQGASGEGSCENFDEGSVIYKLEDLIVDNSRENCDLIKLKGINWRVDDVMVD